MTTPDTAKAAEIVVEQRHRDTTADFLLLVHQVTPKDAQRIREGEWDDTPHVRFFAERDQRPTDTARAGEVDGWTWPHAFIRSLERVVEGGNPGHMSIYPSEARYALHAFSALKATPSPVTDETALSGEAVGLAIWRAYFGYLEPSHIDVSWPTHNLRGKCIDIANAALASTPQPAVAEGVEDGLSRRVRYIVEAPGAREFNERKAHLTRHDMRQLLAAAIRQGQNEEGR